MTEDIPIYNKIETRPKNAVPGVPDGNTCEWCGSPFMPERKNKEKQKYCQDSCRRAAWRAEHESGLAFINAIRRQAREMKSGKLRVWIDIEPKDKIKFQKLYPQNAPISIIRVKAEPEEA